MTKKKLANIKIINSSTKFFFFYICLKDKIKIDIQRKKQYKFCRFHIQQHMLQYPYVQSRINIRTILTASWDSSLKTRTNFSTLNRVFIYCYLTLSMHSHRVRNSAVRVLLFSAIYCIEAATLALKTELQTGAYNEYM